MRAPDPAAILLAALACGTALAHHGWGSYDAAKPVTVDRPDPDLEIREPARHHHRQGRRQGLDRDARADLPHDQSRRQRRHGRGRQDRVGLRLSVHGRERTRCGPSASPSTARRSRCADDRRGAGDLRRDRGLGLRRRHPAIALRLYGGECRAHPVADGVLRRGRGDGPAACRFFPGDLAGRHAAARAHRRDAGIYRAAGFGLGAVRRRSKPRHPEPDVQDQADPDPARADQHRSGSKSSSAPKVRDLQPQTPMPSPRSSSASARSRSGLRSRPADG